MYVRLFCLSHLECWKSEPDGRPNIQEVVSTLKSISHNNVNQVKENDYNSILRLNDKAADINDDLIIENIENIIGIENLQIMKRIQWILKIIPQIP